jgi:lipoprotein-releasing system permease protein
VGAARTLSFLAVRHLATRRRQSVVAILGMAIGTAVFVAMTALMTGMEAKFVRETLRVSAHVTLTDERAAAVPAAELRRQAIAELHRGALVGQRRAAPVERDRRIHRAGEIARVLGAEPGVLAAASQLTGRGVASFGAGEVSVELHGVEPKEQERVTPLGLYVTAGSYAELSVRRDSILVGSGVADDLGVRPGDRLSVSVPGHPPRAFLLVAVIDTGIPALDRTRAYLPLVAAQALFDRPDEVNSISLRLADPDRADEIARRASAVTGYRAESWREQNANWLSVFAIQQAVTWVIVSAIVLVAAFGVLNILIMIVMDKRRDIAILRSVGLTRGDIARLFLLEGAVLGGAGAAAGCGLAAAICWQLGRVHISMEGMIKSDRFIINQDPRFYLYGALFALVAGLAASILPARRAAATEPVDVIRGQM